MTIQDKIAEILQGFLIGVPESKTASELILTLFKDYRNINEPIMKKCDECEGSGEISPIVGNPSKFPCNPCKGKKEVPVMHEVDCRCGGVGSYLIGTKFAPNSKRVACDCKGTGKIKIPLTIKDRLEGK